MFTAKKLLAIAIAELGYMEKETNSQLGNKTANAGDNNYTKYARDLHAAGYYQANKNGYAWCDMFVDWCFLQLCGGDGKKAQEIICQTGLYGAGCKWSAKYYKQQNRYYTSNPQAGDQVFFGKNGSFDHTGIVEKVVGSVLHTIEGNTSNQVARRTYSLSDSYILGFGRPRYDEEGKTSTTTPVIGSASTASTTTKLTVDGKWGKATTTRLQQIFGTTVDGIVSNQWAIYKASNPGLCAGFNWQSKPNGRGSLLIKAMQKWAGMPTGEQDGEIGPKTIKAFQTKLGTLVDGKVDYPSVMVKALQKWANEQ